MTLRAGEAVMQNRLMNRWIIDSYCYCLDCRACTALHCFLPMQPLTIKNKKNKKGRFKMMILNCVFKISVHDIYLQLSFLVQWSRVIRKKSNKTTSWNKFFVPAFYKVRKLSLTPGGGCEKFSSPQAVTDLSPLLIKDQSRQTRGNFQKKWRRTHLSPLCAPGATPAGHHNLCLIANLHLQRWLSKGKAATLH